MKLIRQLWLLGVLVGLCTICGPALLSAQWWDLKETAGDRVAAATGDRLTITLDFRTRYESRQGVDFGRRPDQDGLLMRTRFGMSYKAADWVKLSGMMEDLRSPGFGAASSASTRGSADLLEGYIELGRDRGLGMTVGRKMLVYGDGRLIATPTWDNFNKPFDHARLYYRQPWGRIEFLFLSQVKNLTDEFNRPNLGDRVWGMYNVFENLAGKNQLDVYWLRRTLNRTAGYKGGNKADGTDRYAVNAYGARWAGPLAPNWNYVLEGVVEDGDAGPAHLRAYGWFSKVARHWDLSGKPFDVTAEYKYASGTRDPTDPLRTNTFDTFYASNHNRFGHLDPFGWRNIHNVQATARLGLWKGFALNGMYNNSWLAQEGDALYTNGGGVIAQDNTGASGRHVGQEADVYCTYKYRVFELGAGYGHFFPGGFILKASPGVSPTYVYVFQTYSF